MLRQIATFIFCAAFIAGARGTPTIYWGSDPVGPGETAMLAGVDLDEINSVVLSRLQDDPTKVVSTAEGVTASILQVDNHSLKFIIPSSMPTGVFRYQLNGRHGSVTGFLNCATIYWTQGDEGQNATSGGWVRILGRNISRSERTTLEFVGAAGDRYRVQPTRAGMWDATFPVPHEVSAGRWGLRLYNGQGDTETWQTAGNIDIQTEEARNPFVVDVRAYGARGDGVAQDGRAIEASLEEVNRRGGGTVYLSRGVYRLDRALKIPSGAILKGEGRDATFLFWDDVEPVPAVLIDGFSNFSIEDLTLTANRHRHIIHGGFPRPGSEEDGENISIRRVRVRASNFLGHLHGKDEGRIQDESLAFARNGLDSIALAGRNLVIEDCDVYGSGRSFYLLRPFRARVTNNVFQNGRLGWYTISGADGVLLENNRILGADMESTGGGLNTLFAGTAVSMNILVKGNQFERMFGWDGEALTSDGPGGFYFGRVKLEKPAEVHLVDPIVENSKLPDWRGAGLFVLTERGRGQYARVLSRDKDHLRLDRALVTVPDPDALITVVPMQGRYIIVGNKFEDADVAVQIFGTGVENVVSDNTSSRTKGILFRALYYQHLQPIWYSLISNNEILSPSISGFASIGVWGNISQGPPAPINYMTVIRGNRLKGNANIELRGQYPYKNLVSDPLVERNMIEQANKGIVVRSGVSGELIRSNEFAGVAKKIEIEPK